MAGRPAVGADTSGQLATPLPAATGLRCRHLAPRSVATAMAGLSAVARGASEGWSGRRGSNPRPTAWKAVTLPLSYSRLRELSAPSLRRAGPPAATTQHPMHGPNSTVQARGLRPPSARRRTPRPQQAGLPAVARHRVRFCPRWRAEAGGEGRIRTSEAARATDLQSVAFDRSATSPRLRPSRRATASSCQMLAETKVARFMTPPVFGRRCIPHARRWASCSAGSDAAGMRPPRALRGRRLDAVGASPYS